MNYKRQIIEFAEKNNRYIKTKEIINNNIPKNYLKELVDKKNYTNLKKIININDFIKFN